MAATTWYTRKAQAPDGVPRAWGHYGPTSHDSEPFRYSRPRAQEARRRRPLRRSARRRAEREAALEALTAAATRVTDEKVRRGSDHFESWHAEAWDYYRQVGELRYVARAIAGRMGQAELFTEVDGVRSDQSADDADPILALFSGQMTERLGLNIFVAGGGFVGGLPTDEAKQKSATDDRITPDMGETNSGSVWVALSTMEVSRERGRVTVRGVEYAASDVFLQRVWDPDPANWEESDSPVRSALPVLRELVGLTQHVSAQIDSRLAGAGVYWLPNSILTQGRPAEAAGGQTFSDNVVLNAIMNGMLLPMEDRSNASSVVPILMGAPDDAIGKIRFDSFSTPFDANTKDLRDEAIRRLALNLDAPPELLLGMGDSNHWAAWLVRDEVVTIHVAPRCALLASAYTGIYRAVLRQLQRAAAETLPPHLRAVDPDAVDLHFDASGLVQRPNRLADASQLHAAGALSDKALRQAGGFEESDAPTSQEKAVAVALSIAQGNPQLIDNMPEIVGYVMALLDGTPGTGPQPPGASQREPGTLLPAQQAPAAPGGAAAATTPGGTPAPGGAPLQEADSQPTAGAPA